MLHYSFSTVLMTILASSFIMGFIATIFRHNNTMVHAGRKLLAVLVGVVALRLLLPIEFPFSINIPLPRILSLAISLFRYPFMQIGEIDVSVWLLFETVWIGGIIVNILRFTIEQKDTKRIILTRGKDRTDAPEYKEPLDNICRQYKRKNTFHVIELTYSDSPFIYGILSPYIVLPDSFPIPADKLCFTLHHEALHHFHHDNLLKGVTRILCILYWWFPVCKYLPEQANTLQEMRVDKIITHKEKSIIERYSECLLYMKKQSAAPYPVAFSLKKGSFLFSKPSGKELEKRFIMLQQDTVSWKKVCTGIALSVSVIGIYLASYLFILEASYYPPLVEETTVFLSEENTYFIQIDSSTYEVYFNGMYIETVTDLAFYPKGIKIYNKKGVLIDET